MRLTKPLAIPSARADAISRWVYTFFHAARGDSREEDAVVPLLADTTCCIAVSYEGKAFGVKTGTKVGEAKKLCPGIHLIEGNHENYIKYHNRIVETVESCIPVEAVCSIDEIASRLTGSQQDLGIAGALADKIKSSIRMQVGSSLRCSIGVAPNRYLAKIDADMKKPDGFTAIALVISLPSFIS